MPNSFYVIGVVGHPGSGKDTVGDYLAKKGFKKFSGGDFLRAKMRDSGLSTDRTSVHEFVKQQRMRYGNDYPASEIIKEIDGNAVNVGFRNTEEVAIFKNQFGNKFILFALETPLDLRYERAKQRNRMGDDISLERFKEEELRERAADSGSHEVDNVIAMADVIIINDGTLDELFTQIDAILAKLDL